MARRKIEEINAGSMADIAFLLLIFFLVTTTMEVDAGIGRTLPLNVDNPPDPVEIIERNVLKINVNKNDQLQVEDQLAEMDELYDLVHHFFTANKINKDTDMDMPNYEEVTLGACQIQIGKIQEALDEKPTDTYLLNELTKWQTKERLCQLFPTQSFMEIDKASIIRFETQAKTTYGRYMEIQNVLKKVVNELRIEMCEKMGWGNYHELSDINPDDQIIIKNLRILVPERIVEVKITG